MQFRTAGRVLTIETLNLRDRSNISCAKGMSRPRKQQDNRKGKHRGRKAEGRHIVGIRVGNGLCEVVNVCSIARTG